MTSTSPPQQQFSFYNTIVTLAKVTFLPLCTTLLTLYNKRNPSRGISSSSSSRGSLRGSLRDSMSTQKSSTRESISVPTLEKAMEMVRGWNKVHFAVDVGASNVRLAFLNPESQVTVLPPKTPCNSMSQLLSVFAEVDVLLEDSDAQIAASCLALAGPISGEQISVTNYIPKDCSIHKNDLPLKLFPDGKTYFLNDLEACSFGVVRMGLSGDLWDYMSPNNAGGRLQNHHYAVLAMGTGLGASLIFAVNTRNGPDASLEFDVVPLELGHITLGHELSKDDRDRLDYISSRVYASKFAPEVEEICSGRGLVHCYEYETRDLKDIPTLRARDIAELVKKGDVYAERAMHANYRYLFKVAQHMCILVPQCRGVFLCGDNQVANEAFVSEHLKEFEAEFFENHPKKDWLENVSIYRQVKPLNMNIQGAFHYIEGQLN